MSAGAIRTAIATVMMAVPDIGVVHEYARYTKSMSGIKAFYFSATHGDIRGWHITRRRMNESSPLTGAHGPEETVWEITGYLGVNDAQATELALEVLVEVLREAFRTNDTLNNTVDGTFIVGEGKPFGLQLEEFDHVVFGGVLCHRAKCALYTTRIV